MSSAAPGVVFRDGVTGASASSLEGFFEGWPDPPSPDTLKAILEGSDAVALALEEVSGEVIGFATAITDGVLCGYIPLLEVRSPWRRKGIGKALVRRLLDRLARLYMIDLVCDEDLVPFYEDLGFQRGTAMVLRRYERQSGG